MRISCLLSNSQFNRIIQKNVRNKIRIASRMIFLLNDCTEIFNNKHFAYSIILK